MAKKRVLLIGSVPPPHHGSNIYFENLLRSRVQEVFEVTHLDTSDHRSLDNIERVDLVNVWLGVKNVVELLWLLLTRRFDLIYVPIAPSFPAFLRDGLFLLLARWFSKAPRVVHLHRQGFRREFYDRAGKIGQWFIRSALKGTARAIVLGERLRRAFDGLVPEERVVVVPNGIVPPIDQPPQRNPEKPVVFGYLGNLFRTKGVMELLRAFAVVRRRYPEVRLQIAGGWPDQSLREEVWNFIRDSNLEQSVQIYGIVTGKEKRKFFYDMDVFVFPTYYREGFPLVILEAMAYGCPVISSKDEGTIPEVVVHRKTGILVDPHNIDEIAAAMEWIIEHPQERIAMGMAGRRRFEEEYTMDRNVERMIRLFREVIEEKEVRAKQEIMAEAE